MTSSSSAFTATTPGRVRAQIPRRAGIGLKAQHVAEILETRPALGWFEVHPENYMGDGGRPHQALDAVRAHYPLSFHSVGLSLGSVEGLEPAHLRRFADLIERYEPGLVSDHLAWCRQGTTHFADLLPLPLTQESLEVVTRNVDSVQTALKRTILIENPTTYLALPGTIDEPAFLIALAERTGCRLLVDVNNVVVNAHNGVWRDPDLTATGWLDAMPGPLVGEVHLAGHAVDRFEGGSLRIDDHGSPIPAEVWSLYARLIDRIGPVPTLIERDRNIPPLEDLLDEAERADRLLDQAHRIGPLVGSAHG